MAITTTITARVSLGNKKMIIGKSVISGGTNTGDVVVPLKYIETFQAMTEGSAQKGIAVNETFPTKDTNPTLIMESNDGTVTWIAIGY